jgi:hypothetical protein
MNKKYFMCECHCGVIAVDYDPDFGLDMSFYERNPKRSFKNRIRLAWSALRGRPYTDMVILNDNQLADLVDYLVAIQNGLDKRTPIFEIINKLHEYDSKEVIDNILEYLKNSKSSSHVNNLISEITPLKY